MKSIRTDGKLENWKLKNNSFNMCARKTGKKKKSQIIKYWHKCGRTSGNSSPGALGQPTLALASPQARTAGQLAASWGLFLCVSASVDLGLWCQRTDGVVQTHGYIVLGDHWFVPRDAGKISGTPDT